MLGIGLSLFLTNVLVDQDESLYVLSIPLVVYGFIRLYQRHFGPRYYSADSFFASAFDDVDDDDLYEDAVEAVTEAGKASTSYLQRKLRIGYSRAARLMDLLEENEVIGPQIGSAPREILKKNDENK